LSALSRCRYNHPADAFRLGAMLKSAIIVLAMSGSKQLLEFQGKPLVRHAVEAACGSGCSPVVVVLGAWETEMRAALKGLRVEVVINRRWEEGAGTSIQAGLSALADCDVCGAIVASADQPFITAEYLRGLVTTHFESLKPIVASKYAGTAGVPAFFAEVIFPLLMALKPDQDCKDVILAHRADALLVECPEGGPVDHVRVARG